MQKDVEGGSFMAKVLILMGSPRPSGNTALLCSEFTKGAEEAGNEVETAEVAKLDINGCLGCCACQANGGSCIQKDDMQEVYEKIQQADVIAIASPIYFYTWTAQTKKVLDRMFAKMMSLQNKKFYLISACGSEEEQYTETMLDTFRKFHECFAAGGNSEGGYVFGLGSMAPGDVKGTPALEKAYDMGKSI
jgi:multimeric flavodoxin WrbA